MSTVPVFEDLQLWADLGQAWELDTPHCGEERS